MTSPIQTCTPEDNFEKCGETLADNRFRHLVVVDKQEPVGVISLRDLALRRK